jgi:putative phage-type endonuclease
MTRIDPLIDRDAWLAERRKGIGASEAAAALGVSPFMSPRHLYLSKLGLLTVTEDERMRWGTLLEPVILDEYCRRTGEVIADRQLFKEGRTRHPLQNVNDPGLRLFATLDAVCESGRHVEVKTTSERSAGGIADAILPAHVQIQTQLQMFIAKQPSMDVAYLIGGQRMEIVPALYDAGMTEQILEGLLRFWGHVERGEPPPSTGRDTDVMHIVYPGCDGEIELEPYQARLVDAYADLKSGLKGAKTLQDGLRGEILEIMGNARVARLPDGRTVTRSIRNVKESTVTRKASTYTVLSISGGDDDGEGQ